MVCTKTRFRDWDNGVLSTFLKMFRNVLLNDELLSKIVKGSGAGLILKIGSAGFSFLMFLFLARAMGAEEYGVFSFAFSVSVFLSIFASMGLPTAILKWYPALNVRDQSSRANDTLFWGARTTVCFSVAVAGIGAIALWVMKSDASLYYAIALLIPLAFADYLAGALRAFGSVITALLPKDILWRLSVLIFALFMLATGHFVSAKFSLGFMAVMLAIFTVLQFAFLRIKVGHATEKRDKIAAKPLIRETVPMWGIALLGAFSQNLDVILIGILMSPDIVGPYFAATRIANLLGLMMIASDMISAPLISRYFAANDMFSLQRTLRLVSLGISIPTLCAYAVLIFVGKALLSWFGDGFEVGYVPLLILAGGFAFNAVSGPIGYLMQMTENARSYFNVMIVTYALVVPMQIVLILNFGVNGAAFGTLVALVMRNVWVRRITVKKIGVDPTLFQFLKRPQAR